MKWLVITAGLLFGAWCLMDVASESAFRSVFLPFVLLFGSVLWLLSGILVMVERTEKKRHQPYSSSGTRERAGPLGTGAGMGGGGSSGGGGDGGGC